MIWTLIAEILTPEVLLPWAFMAGWLGVLLLGWDR